MPGPLLWATLCNPPLVSSLSLCQARITSTEVCGIELAIVGNPKTPSRPSKSIKMFLKIGIFLPIIITGIFLPMDYSFFIYIKRLYYNMDYNIVFSFSWFGLAELVEKRTWFEPLHSLGAKMCWFHSLNTIGVGHHHPAHCYSRGRAFSMPVGFLPASLTPVSPLHSLLLPLPEKYPSPAQMWLSSLLLQTLVRLPITSRTKLRPWDSGPAPLPGFSRQDSPEVESMASGTRLFGFPPPHHHSQAVWCWVVQLSFLCLGFFTCKSHIINDVSDSKN